MGVHPDLAEDDAVMAAAATARRWAVRSCIRLDPDDAFQVAWIEARRAADRFDGRGSLFSWCLLRAKGAVRDEARRWNGVRSDGGELRVTGAENRRALLPDVPDPDPGPEDIAVAHDLLRRVACRMTGREAVALLARINRIDYDLIGEMIGMSGSGAWRMLRATQRPVRPAPVADILSSRGR